MGKLIEAINNGNVQAVKTLLSGTYRNSRLLNEENIEYPQEVADRVGCDKATPLLLAISKKNLQIISMLIQAGTNVNYFTNDVTWN